MHERAKNSGSAHIAEQVAETIKTFQSAIRLPKPLCIALADAVLFVCTHPQPR